VGQRTTGRVKQPICERSRGNRGRQPPVSADSQSCHGGEARGDRGSALATGSFRHGDEDDDLFHNIRTDIPGTQMPAFSGLATDDIWRIISYLRSLSGNGAAANEVVPGDVAAGEKTF
jgi:mono/diheme cytochrome c family protein